jgi:hypothetical protein
MAVVCLVLPKQAPQMTTKQVLKCLDGVQRVFVKLEKVAFKAYLLATLIYALYKIIAQH